MKIGIMTDVNSGIDYLPIVPPIVNLRSSVNFNDKSYVDGVDIKAGEFYERIKNITNPNEIPSTSAPSVADIYAAFDRFIEEGYTDVIHYPISYELSSTGPTVEQIALEYKDKLNIHIVNTKTAAYLQGYIACEAYRMAQSGATIDEILAYSDYLINHNHAYFLVKDLGYLVKNGRLSNAAGFLGTLLKVKPILEINKLGKIVTLEKVKTYKRALDRTIELILKYIGKHKKVKLLGFHSLNIEAIEYVLSAIKEARPDITDVEIHYITPAVGAHIGSGVIGIGAFLL